MKASTLHAVGVTDIGKVRKNNEDSLLVLPDSLLFCVADGMGGAIGGEFASQTVCAAVAEAAGLFGDRMPLPERVAALRNAIDRSSREIRAWAESQSVKGTGTTVVLLALDPVCPGQGVLLHAGDSRAYRLRGGALEPLTRDHSVAEAYAKGSDAAVPAMLRNVVTNAIGMSDAVRLEEQPVSFRARDLVLLCSDGLYRMVSDAEMTQILGDAALPLSSRAGQLMQAALDGGGRDNVTLALIEYGVEVADHEWTERDTHETDVVSAREAAAMRHRASPSSSEDSNIMGRPLTEQSDTHERVFSPPAKSSARRCLVLGIILGLLILMTLLMWSLSRPRAFPAGRLPVADPVSVGDRAMGDYASTVSRAASAPMAAEQTVAEKIAAARRSGRWDVVAAALAAEHMHQDIDRDLESVARSWVTEWERVHGRPELARGELEAFRAQAGRMTHLWARDAMVAPLERWSDDPQEAASIYCRNKEAIQADVFRLLDEYVRRSTVFLEIFGEDPDRIEALLRSAAIQGVDVPLVLGDRIQRLRERMRGLKRWKDQTRDLPVGLTDMRNATGTFIEPLEEGQRNVVDLVATYLWEIPSLSSADETYPSVRDFHQQKDDLLEAIRLRQHHSASGRADMAELIAGLLHSQGLHELATPSVREGL